MNGDLLLTYFKNDLCLKYCFKNIKGVSLTLKDYSTNTC